MFRRLLFAVILNLAGVAFISPALAHMGPRLTPLPDSWPVTHGHIQSDASKAPMASMGSGFCQVMAGPPYDAFPGGTTGVQQVNMDSLDVLQVSMASDASNLYIQDTLLNAHSGPNGGPIIWGRTNVYGWEWTDGDGKTTDVVRAEYPGKPDPNNPSDFTVSVFYGQIDPLDAPGAGTVTTVTMIGGWGTGTMDSAHDRLTVAIPLGAFHEGTGTDIAVDNAYTLVGTGVPRWVYPDPNTPPTGGSQLYADHADITATQDFVVGRGCKAAG